MSNFLTVVLIPGTTKPEAVEDVIAAALAPFDEGLGVPEYEQRCWCIGQEARNEAREQAKREIGGIEVFRASFAAEHPLPTGVRHEFDLPGDEQDAREYAWKQHIKPLLDAEARALAAHPLREAASAECSSCKGAGTYRTTYNPKANWDWYEIGGRWSGTLGEDVTPVEQVLARGVIPFAILTPDGEWHERAHMGWWGMKSDNKPPDAWKDEAAALFTKHRECIAVAVDCHI